MNKPDWQGVHGVVSLHMVIASDKEKGESGRVYIQSMVNEGKTAISVKSFSKAAELANKLEKEWNEFIRANQP